jgi:hypothetical protein
MNIGDWLIAVPYFAGGLLIWPLVSLFRRRLDERGRWLRMVFFVTLVPLGAIGGLLGVVALLGKFNHNWLPVTMLFPVINLLSIFFSISGVVLSRKDVGSPDAKG